MVIVMRHFKNSCWFAVGMLIAAVWMAPYAHAQTSLIFDTKGNIIGSYAEVSHATLNAAYGVADRSAGQVVVRGATGTAVTAAVAVERQVAKAAIAKAAAKIAVKAIPGVGTVAALAELCDLLCTHNYRVAPDGSSLQQIEQPGIAGDDPGMGYFYIGASNIAKTPQASCNLLASTWASTNTAYDVTGTVSADYRCTVKGVAKNNPAVITTPYNALELQKSPNYYVPQYILPTEISTQADIQQYAEQRAAWKPVYDAMHSDAASAGSSWPSDYSPIDATTPVVVTAPPVTSSPRVVSTGTQTKPDGSVDSITRTETTTVTPTTTGTTVGDSKTTFPTSVTTTTNITNNVTNTAVTNTETVNQPPDTAASPDGPDDPCASHPNRAGCSDLGTPPQPEAIPQQDVPITISPVLFASSASCPAPINYNAYGARTISFQPFCDWASSVRGLFLALGALACAWIMFEGLRSV
jgi:hypothetical protein